MVDGVGTVDDVACSTAAANGGTSAGSVETAGFGEANLCSSSTRRDVREVKYLLLF